MRVSEEPTGWYLVGSKCKVALSDSELDLLRRMTPMGRKVTLRKHATDRIARNPADAGALDLMELIRLPASEWNFIVP